MSRVQCSSPRGDLPTRRRLEYNSVEDTQSLGFMEGVKLMATEREREIRRRRHRRKKLKYLRGRLAKATSDAERRKIIEKIRRISPRAPIEL